MIRPVPELYPHEIKWLNKISLNCRPGFPVVPGSGRVFGDFPGDIIIHHFKFPAEYPELRQNPNIIIESTYQKSERLITACLRIYGYIYELYFIVI